VQADDCGVAVELGHDALDTVQVARAGVPVDSHPVTDRQHRERFLRVDGVQQIKPGANGFTDRDQVRVELACGDLVEQEPLGLGARSGACRDMRVQLAPRAGRRATSGALADAGMIASGPDRTGSSSGGQ
jgi:hypothetical protein